MREIVIKLSPEEVEMIKECFEALKEMEVEVYE